MDSVIQKLTLLCPDCGQETLADGCWQCLEKPHMHPVLHRNANFREGILCVRQVQIETDLAFEILYLRTESNIDALEIARHRCPEANFISARPVGD